MMARTQATRDIILREAADLFARKGYGAVGVREIAGQAKVNISLISYYFDGKLGVLREIINLFFDRYAEAVEASFAKGKDAPMEEKISLLVGEIVQCIRQNQNMFKVAFFELPYDVAEINEIRATNINRIRALLGKHYFEMMDINDKTLPHLPIIGPAVMAMIFSHFTMGPALQNVFDQADDDEFFLAYVSTISRLILRGLPEVVQELNRG
jgi:AcrR family transcriptional regulator